MENELNTKEDKKMNKYRQQLTWIDVKWNDDKPNKQTNLKHIFILLICSNEMSGEGWKCWRSKSIYWSKILLLVLTLPDQIVAIHKMSIVAMPIVQHGNHNGLKISCQFVTTLALFKSMRQPTTLSLSLYLLVSKKLDDFRAKNNKNLDHNFRLSVFRSLFICEDENDK